MKNLDTRRHFSFSKLPKISIIIGIILVLSFSRISFAQEALSGTGVAISIPVAENVQDGDIIISTQSGYKLGDNPYQASIYGVITNNPAVFLENGDSSIVGKTYPVLTSGKAFVRVTTANGEIKKNDYITTSETKGVGQKAENNGFVLGIALEDYSENDTTKVGKILVYINPHFNADFVGARENIIENIKNLAAAPSLAPLTTFRYVLAAAIAVGSFVIGFIHFGRIVKTGIEALGRNPLASVFIQVSVVMNVVLTIGIVLAGLAIAYLILAL